tara:strand:- start:5 stop:364 length:360 start_codon:yes stop_codon:yes gene_type:complete
MTKSYIHIGEDIVDASTVTKPNNKDFRDAWQLKGTVVEVNMTLARAIHKDKIRQARITEFAINDIAINDALLSDDAEAKTSAIARRDALRDATDGADIEAATTPEELTAAWPLDLEKPL